jgi:lysophospholipase L1-like esterase
VEVLVAALRPLLCSILFTSVAVAASAQTPPAQTAAPSGTAARLELRQNDHVVFLGNTLAERMQQFNHFETELMTRFPELQLVVRNLGWSGDTITLQPRPLNFGDAAKHLQLQKADVIFAFFGLNESFDGEAGLPKFEKDLDAYLQTHQQAKYNGTTAPRLVLVSPIAHEKLAHLVHVDVEARNRELARYTEAMRGVAARRQVTFVDLYTPTKRAMEAASTKLTINGIHVNEEGDRVVARMLMDALGFDAGTMRDATASQLKELETLRGAIQDKNQEFFYRFRPVNAEYVVGRRVEPFGSKNFPPEMVDLDKRVSERDRKIWSRARDVKGLRFGVPVAGASSASNGPGARD